jgi:sterol 3beta-glucosyltransferase
VHTIWDRFYRFNAPQILGFSPTSFRLDTPPADWKLFDYAITGDWVLSADDLPEKPHAALVQFIEAGEEPPLYIGWGSMAHESGQYMTELAVRARCTRPGTPQRLLPCHHSSPSPPQVRALHAVGKRGIIFEGSSGSELFRLGLDKLDASKPDAAEVAAWAAKNVLVTGGVSHEWLFSKVAAIVHHGGAGTSAASFRAGVPSLVTPFGIAI